MSESKLLSQLKDLLLEDERKSRDELEREVVELRQELMVREKLGKKVDPLLDERMDYLKDNFPELFGTQITASIKKQIIESQDEVIEALYPIMGRLIRKYIQKEIELLSERIDRQLENTFSLQAWRDRIKGWFSGSKESDRLISNLSNPIIEEIFLVEKLSGLLLGKFSRQDVVDDDMVAGMLTAIKSFVEDAFREGGQDLETIAYDTYRIILLNFPSKYLAFVVSGVPTAEFKSQLTDLGYTFAEEYLKSQVEEITDEVQADFSEKLKLHFSFQDENH